MCLMKLDKLELVLETQRPLQHGVNLWHMDRFPGGVSMTPASVCFPAPLVRGTATLSAKYRCQRHCLLRGLEDHPLWEV